MARGRRVCAIGKPQEYHSFLCQKSGQGRGHQAPNGVGLCSIRFPLFLSGRVRMGISLWSSPPPPPSPEISLEHRLPRRCISGGTGFPAWIFFHRDMPTLPPPPPHQFSLGKKKNPPTPWGTSPPFGAESFKEKKVEFFTHPSLPVFLPYPEMAYRDFPSQLTVNSISGGCWGWGASKRPSSLFWQEGGHSFFLFPGAKPH